MNSDQINSLIRSGLKIGAGWLMTHGYVQAATVLNGESAIGLILALAGLLLSHATHKADSAPAVPSADGSVPVRKTGITNAPLMLLLVAALLPIPALTTGCTSPQRAAYQIAVVNDQAVIEAVNAWNVYVQQAHPPIEQQQAVYYAWQKWQSATFVYLDAGKALAAATATNAAGVTGLQAAFQQALDNKSQLAHDVLNLIHQFNPKIT